MSVYFKSTQYISIVVRGFFILNSFCIKQKALNSAHAPFTLTQTMSLVNTYIDYNKQLK